MFYTQSFFSIILGGGDDYATVTPPPESTAEYVRKGTSEIIG